MAIGTDHDEAQRDGKALEPGDARRSVGDAAPTAATAGPETVGVGRAGVVGNSGIVALQRLAGNRGVASLMASQAGRRPLTVQRRRSRSTSENAAEEADQMSAAMLGAVDGNASEMPTPDLLDSAASLARTFDRASAPRTRMTAARLLLAAQAELERRATTSSRDGDGALMRAGRFGGPDMPWAANRPHGVADLPAFEADRLQRCSEAIGAPGSQSGSGTGSSGPAPPVSEHVQEHPGSHPGPTAPGPSSAAAPGGNPGVAAAGIAGAATGVTASQPSMLADADERAAEGSTIEQIQASQPTGVQGGGPDLQRGMETLRGVTLGHAIEAVARRLEEGNRDDPDFHGASPVQPPNAGASLFGLTQEVWYLAHQMYIVDREGFIAPGDFHYSVDVSSLSPGTYFFGTFVTRGQATTQSQNVLLRLHDGQAEVTSGDISPHSVNTEWAPLTQRAQATINAHHGICLVVSAHQDLLEHDEGLVGAMARIDSGRLQRMLQLLVQYCPVFLNEQVRDIQENLREMVSTTVMWEVGGRLAARLGLGEALGLYQLYEMATQVLHDVGDSAELIRLGADEESTADETNLAAQALAREYVSYQVQAAIQHLLSAGHGDHEGARRPAPAEGEGEPAPTPATSPAAPTHDVTATSPSEPAPTLSGATGPAPTPAPSMNVPAVAAVAGSSPSPVVSPPAPSATGPLMEGPATTRANTPPATPPSTPRAGRPPAPPGGGTLIGNPPPAPDRVVTAGSGGTLPGVGTRDVAPQSGGTLPGAGAGRGQARVEQAGRGGAGAERADVAGVAGVGGPVASRSPEVQAVLDQAARNGVQLRHIQGNRYLMPDGSEIHLDPQSPRLANIAQQPAAADHPGHVDPLGATAAPSGQAAPAHPAPPQTPPPAPQHDAGPTDVEPNAAAAIRDEGRSQPVDPLGETAGRSARVDPLAATAGREPGQEQGAGGRRQPGEQAGAGARGAPAGPGADTQVSPTRGELPGEPMARPQVGAGVGFPERRVRGSDVRSVRPMPGGHQGGTVVVTMADGSEWVFKPAENESADLLMAQPHGIEAGQHARRAAAASELAAQAGIDSPETILAVVDGVRDPLIGDGSGRAMVGSLQRFEPGLRSLREIQSSNPELFDRIVNSQTFRDMDAFDYLLGSMDRHMGNLLVDVDPATGSFRRLVAIDNDLSLPPREFRYGPIPEADAAAHYAVGQARGNDDQVAIGIWRGVFSHQRGIPSTISEPMYNRLQEMASNRDGLTRAMSPFLTPAEITGALARLDEILANVQSGETEVVRPSGGAGSPGAAAVPAAAP